jgi:hypothetical protein
MSDRAQKPPAAAIDEVCASVTNTSEPLLHPRRLILVQPLKGLKPLELAAFGPVFAGRARQFAPRASLASPSQRDVMKPSAPTISSVSESIV